MPTTNDIHSYRRIRRAIGYLGISLPIILIILSNIPFFNTEVQTSISHYYYTNLREIFTGTLCAVGLFLIRYKGLGNASIWKNDNFLTNLAGLMALGVALLPTSPDKSSQKVYSIIPINNEVLGWVHYGCAGMLLGIFSILAINVFTIGQKREAGVPYSVLNENNIYRFCGYSIVLFIILVPVFSYFKLYKNATLILEALSLFAFGLAWLIKGRALGDKGETGKKLYGEANEISTEAGI